MKNNRDGSLESPWQRIATRGPMPASDSPDDNSVYDVLIIGGGITGITAGLMLQVAGKKCVIAEAHNIGFGTTGGTSAHINTFADTSYGEAESAFGAEGAGLFAAAINDGFGIIKKNIERLDIDCDFETKDGYVYAEDDEQVKELQELYAGTIKQNVSVNFSKSVPTPIAYKEALIFKDQAQFHPLKYLTALQRAYVEAGGIVVENFRIDKVESDSVHRAISGDTCIKAKAIIYATHIPPGINIFNTRCAPYRSYVLGVTLKDKKYPDALVYDMQEPYHYFRTHKVNGRYCLIAGGNDHKTGHEESEKAFADLEKYVRKHYDVAEVLYRWSSQYYVPVDGFPYIGHMPGAADGIYCATGYSGNGMMLGSIAAKIIADLILDKENKYEQIFDPSRLKPVAGFKEFIKENADVAYQFVASRFTAQEMDSIKTLKKDSGQIIDLQGKKMAVYKDADGQIYALKPVCTHAKCIVNWNGEEKSWDCPCHGARYDINGIVLNGPAEENLQKLDL